ncbi:MAG TPA: NAD-dependent epimerase/dehydratase family protein [Gemmatimonadales bacterium]|nr:NAD-dependent epimerase/dehydratase family protein [Gemmatimonadales bacterium]
MTTRALITGGAGFIGSHLAEALLDQGWEVAVLDDLSTGRFDNVAHLVGRSGFTLTIGSASDRAAMAPLVGAADVVFHLAAAVGVRLVVEQPVRTIETNIKTTETVLALAAARGSRVLLASTSEVYGKLDGRKFAEHDDVVLGPTSRSRWCYAASKMIEEFLGIAYATEHGLPVTIVRPFNIIGPRQTGRYGMVVPRFVRQALRGEPLTVYGDGTQRRSFTWVGDVVTAMIALVQHPGAVGEVYNVGHTQEIEIRELARLVLQLTGSDSDIAYVPFEQAYEHGFEDMTRRLPDISKIERLIDYRPTLALPEMLERIIAGARPKVAAGAEPQLRAVLA